MEENAKQASAEEVKRNRRRCFSPNCKKRAFLKDYGGWEWCFEHWYKSWRWGGGNKWYVFKTTKVF